MNNAVEVKKLPIPEVVFKRGCEWRRAKKCLNVYVNEQGELLVRRDNNDYIKQTPKKHKEYQYTNVITEEFSVENKAIHQLVCSTFHGDPPDDGEGYEPNHKDGNKSNNRADNLEWVTRSQNVLHAFEIGLCTVGVRIKATNVITKETKEFNSFSAAARYFGVTREIFHGILIKHKYHPYQDKWLFDRDDSSDKRIARYQAQDVIYKDYVSGDICICKDAMQASYLTGVKSPTIRFRLRSSNQDALKYRLLSKYVFKLLSDETPWPEYTTEQALESEKKYKTKLAMGKCRRCLAKNYLTGETGEYESIIEVAEHVIGKTTNRKNIVALANLLGDRLISGSLKMVKGIVVKDIDDIRPWPDYSEEEIRSSFEKGKKTIEVTDIVLNTTKTYASKLSFIKHIGGSETRLNRSIKQNIAYFDRYKVKLLS